MKKNILILMVLLCMFILLPSFCMAQQQPLTVTIDYIYTMKDDLANKQVVLSDVFVDSAQTEYNPKTREWVTTFKISDKSSKQTIMCRSVNPVKVPDTIKTLKAEVIYNPQQNQTPVLNVVSAGGGTGPFNEPWKIAIVSVLGILLVVAVFQLIKAYGGKDEEESVPIRGGAGGPVVVGPQQVIPTTTPPTVPANRPAAIPPMIRPASDEHKVLIPQNPRPVQQKDPSTRQVISGGGNTAGKNDPTIQVNTKAPEKKTPTTSKNDATEAIVTAGGVLIEDGGENKTFQLDRYNIYIGRDVELPDIVLPYKWVSRKHARISYDSRVKKYVIHNESDANPMEINGEVKLAAELNEGDVITLGKTRLIFKYGVTK